MLVLLWGSQLTDHEKPESDAYHATTVAVGNEAVMITGPSGSGKSSLALQLIGLGAKLVSDDQSVVVMEDGLPVVVAPQHLQGVIEARGVGLLNVPWQQSAKLRLVVDMSENEVERLPQNTRRIPILGRDIELVLRVDAPYFASALHNLVRHGRYVERG